MNKKKLSSKDDNRLEMLIICISLVFVFTLLLLPKEQTLTWIQKGNILIKGNQTLEIGEFYPYAATNNGEISYFTNPKWKVLGLDENSNVLIVSASNVEQLELGNKENIETAKTDYATGYKILDTIALEYYDGTNAINARSLRIEDINKLTGYIVKPNDVTYQFFWNGTSRPSYKTNKAKTGFLKNNHDQFFWYTKSDERWNRTNNPKEIEQQEYITTCENTWYTYDINFENEKIYNMIFLDEENKPSSYWLASIYTKIDNDILSYGYYNIVNEKLDTTTLLYSNGTMPTEIQNNNLGIRVVITLDI